MRLIVDNINEQQNNKKNVNIIQHFAAKFGNQNLPSYLSMSLGAGETT